MNLRSIGPLSPPPMPQASSPARSATDFASTLETASKIEAVEQPSEMREAFTDFVGQTLFGSMLTSMRKTVGKPAYMHGGRTEEVFQQQLDQHIVENLTKSSASSIADPMFELFNLQRRS